MKLPSKMRSRNRIVMGINKVKKKQRAQYVTSMLYVIGKTNDSVGFKKKINDFIIAFCFF